MNTRDLDKNNINEEIESEHEVDEITNLFAQAVYIYDEDKSTSDIPIIQQDVLTATTHNEASKSKPKNQPQSLSHGSDFIKQENNATTTFINKIFSHNKNENVNSTSPVVSVINQKQPLNAEPIKKTLITKQNIPLPLASQTDAKFKFSSRLPEIQNIGLKTGNPISDSSIEIITNDRPIKKVKK